MAKEEKTPYERGEEILDAYSKGEDLKKFQRKGVQSNQGEEGEYTKQSFDKYWKSRKSVDQAVDRIRSKDEEGSLE